MSEFPLEAKSWGKLKRKRVQITPSEPGHAFDAASQFLQVEGRGAGKVELRYRYYFPGIGPVGGLDREDVVGDLIRRADAGYRVVGGLHANSVLCHASPRAVVEATATFRLVARQGLEGGGDIALFAVDPKVLAAEV